MVETQFEHSDAIVSIEVYSEQSNASKENGNTKDEKYVLSADRASTLNLWKISASNSD